MNPADLDPKFAAECASLVRRLSAKACEPTADGRCPVALFAGTRWGSDAQCDIACRSAAIVRRHEIALPVADGSSAGTGGPLAPGASFDSTDETRGTAA